MKYDAARWEDRMRNRIDLVTRLTHLTRGDNDDEAFENLMQILKDKTIKAQNAKQVIIGRENVCCFQELPLYAIAENLKHEEKEDQPNLRYSPFGIRLLKGDFYKRGGRPAIYVNKTEKNKVIERLPEFQWRLVSMDLDNPDSIIDWSHEREWRYNKDYPFEYEDIEIIVASPRFYRRLMDECIGEYDRIVKECNGIIVLNSVYN